MIRIKWAIFFIFSFLLSGCSIFSPVKEDAIQYEVKCVPSVPTKHAASRKTLMVSQPDVRSMLDTTAMAYSKEPYQIDYFAKHRWSLTPASMLQPLIVQTLQNTHYFYAIGSGGSLGRYDYVLNTELIQFQQWFFQCRSIFKMTLRAELVDANSGKIVAAHQFCVTARAPCCSPYGGVIAANEAAATLLRQLAGWVLVKI